MTMAWIDSITPNLLTWLSTAPFLPDMIAVRCLTFDSTGAISLSADISELTTVMATRSDTKWLLSISNADEAAFVAVRDNTAGARDTLISGVRSLKLAYPAFRGLDVRLSSASDNTHVLPVRDLVTSLYIQYKHAFVQGHYNLTLPGVRETDCTWVYHSSFRGFYNTVTALFPADVKLSYIDSVLREFRAWYDSEDILLGLPAAGRLYCSNGTVSDLPFGTIAGYMLGTRSLAEDQPLAGFAGVYNPTELTTMVFPYVLDYADHTATLRPQPLEDSAGQTLISDSLSLFAIARRHTPTPVVYWQDSFLNYDTLENYNSDNGEYSVEEDWEGETNQSYLAGRGTLLYKARTFTNFYASLTFLEPSDRTSYFGITGIICGNLMVVYNDPYDRIEVRQGPYLNDSFILATYSVPLERSDQPFAAPHWFKLEIRKRGNVVTVYYGGKPVINQAVSSVSGYVGVYSHYMTLCSELVIGDAYKYQARESTSLSLAGHTYTFGRVARTGATWNGSVFALSGTNEEVASRSTVLDGSIEAFSLGEATGLTIGFDAALTISSDPGVELVALCLCDSRGGGVIQFRSSLDLQELYNRLVFDHSFAGLALDGLGAEDAAIWGLV